MKTILTIIMLLVTVTSKAQFKSYTTEVDSGYSRNSVNTAIFRNSALCTFKDTQFVAFYDKDRKLCVGKRHVCESGFSTDKFQLVKKNYEVSNYDAHNVASIGIDGEGYVHVVFDEHNSKLKYVMSERPFSLDFGPMMMMTSPGVNNPNIYEKDVTYPEFYRFSNGDLLFCYRNVNNLVINRYNLKTHKWEQVCNNLLENDSWIRPYWQVSVSSDDVIHISWTWRDKAWDTNTNHDIYYAQSSDFGKSWHTVKGESMQVPFMKQNTAPVWNVPQNSNLINQTSMSTDNNGNPYIATYWESDSVTNYRLVYYDGHDWKCATVSDRKSTFKLSGIGTLYIPIARPRVLVSGDNIYYLCRDQELGSVVTMYYAKMSNNGKDLKFRHCNLTDYTVDAWEPCIDTELWKDEHRLHIFVQQTFQNTNEGTLQTPPTMVKVMEVDVK